MSSTGASGEAPGTIDGNGSNAHRTAAHTTTTTTSTTGTATTLQISDDATATTTKASFMHRLGNHLNADVEKRWADLILLFSYAVTGLLDSSAVYFWGSFVSMQTGNTVYLGLGIVEPSESTRWIKAAVSISAFCAGSLCFSSFHRYFSPRRRWVLVVSSSVQTLLISVAAIMVSTGEGEDKNGNKHITYRVIVPLSLVAFQSSGQAVISRALQFNSLTSVVLTSIYCDLFSDPKLFTAGITENAERNRRAAAPVLFLVSAICGGLYAHSSIGLQGALWTAVGMKFCIVLTWLAWRADTVRLRSRNQ